jgi:transposase-like protein
MPTQSIKRSPADKLFHVHAWQASGLTVAAYCRSHRISKSTFRGWINAFSVQPQQSSENRSSSATAIPIIIAANTTPNTIQRAAKHVAQQSTQQFATKSTQTTASSSLFLTHQSGWQLHLPCDIAPTWLAQLLGAI